LTLDNSQQQKNDSQYWSIIQYSYLTELELVEAHKSYLEEFLLDSKTILLNNVCLHANYNCLEIVASNFTEDSIRFNCWEIKCLFFTR
ncbi:unnamed protein product, partial [Rotaria sordida]